MNMKKIIVFVLAAAMLLGASSCGRSSAGEERVLDLTSSEAVSAIAASDSASLLSTIADPAESSAVTSDEVYDIIDIARKIYDEYDAVNLESGKITFDASAKNITAETIENAETYSPELDKYSDRICGVNKIAIELLKMRFPESATFLREYNPKTNMLYPTAQFVLDMSKNSYDNAYDAIFHAARDGEDIGEYIECVENAIWIVDSSVGYSSEDRYIGVYPSEREEAAMKRVEALSISHDYDE